ncbi:MAG: 50S ribosomal protein L22 [Candidatus Omnitrophica bacterium]|nr:50S ribosomal protein L22 [Candidatus Omnitrophota bacterium]
MISRAIGRYLKISARKVRIVADIVRGKTVSDALGILMNTNKKAAELLGDVIESAANNAKFKHRDKKLSLSDLVISKIMVDGGPALVRYRAASLGRASMIRKRSSHILIEIDMIPDKIKELKESDTKAKSKTAKPKNQAGSVPVKQRATKKQAHGAGSK